LTAVVTLLKVSKNRLTNIKVPSAFFFQQGMNEVSVESFVRVLVSNDKTQVVLLLITETNFQLFNIALKNYHINTTQFNLE